MIGEEHHPGAGIQPGLVQRVQYLADRGVGRGDGPVEVGEIAAYLRGVGQVVGQLDGRAVGRLVAVSRIGTVGFEKSRRQQKRLPVGLRVLRPQPVSDLVHHVVAVRVRHVELVEAQAFWVGGLVLHTEKR